MDNDFSVVFQPIEIGTGKKKLKIKNRLIMPPMVTCTANTLGEASQRQVDYYVERAKGGVGAICVEAMDIDDEMLFNRLGIFHDKFINELEYLASSIKENGARAIGQINQTGIRGYLPGPDDLTEDQIKVLIDAYGQAADRTQRAGFEALNIHGAHGYLISSFLSPLYNHRTDKYGGDAQQRTTFAREVIQTVRSAVGEDFPIIFRMNGDDYLEGGVKVEMAKISAKAAEEAGADVIDVSAGVGIMAHDISLGDNRSYFHMVQPMSLPRGCLVHLAEPIKNEVSVPVSIVGRINEPFMVRDILAAGHADIVCLGRALIADPYFPQKMAEGRYDDIRSCIACNYCHGKRIRAIKHLHCGINPVAGREVDLNRVKPVIKPKKVMVIGGGPAGMEAARWLKKRGHQPAIYEMTDQLGGQLLIASVPPHKTEIETFRTYLVRQMGKLGIEINLMTKVTPEMILEKKPDAVVVAAGAKQIVPDIPIDASMKSCYAWDVLSGCESIDSPDVAVLGGSFVAAEVAEYLATKGKNVTIIVRRNLIAHDMEPNSRQMLVERLKDLDVKFVFRVQVEEVTSKGVKGKNLDSNEAFEFNASSVVLAWGAETVEFPLADVERAGIECHLIGDAYDVAGIAEATRGGFIAGTQI